MVPRVATLRDGAHSSLLTRSWIRRVSKQSVPARNSAPPSVGRNIILLREYREAYSLRVAAADVAGLIDIDGVAASLSALAQALLCQALTLAERTLRTPEQPQTDTELGIVAYGKLGSQELGYHSG